MQVQTDEMYSTKMFLLYFMVMERVGGCPNLVWKNSVFASLSKALNLIGLQTSHQPITNQFCC